MEDNMIAEEQDIIMIKNIMFKDQNKLDLRLHGHPVLIIHKTDDYFYYVTISSTTNKNPHKLIGQHYELKKNNINKLTSPISYINLKNIYKEETKGYIPIGHVNDSEYLKILKQLSEFQKKYKEDEYFKEVTK